MAAQNERLATRLAAEIDAHLKAMRRFASFWQLLDTPPSTEQWQRQAALYHRDFRYFLNIAYIDADSRIVHAHPMTTLNRSTLGTRLFDAQPDGRAVLEPALRDGREGHTDILELLQGGAGIIHYLPILKASDETPLGVVAMVVSLPVLAETLFSQVPASQGVLSLRDDDRLLAQHGNDSRPGPWHFRTELALSGKVLSLSSHPRRDILLAAQPRLPVISLSMGLILAYLLYLVLYAFRSLAFQHQSMHHSNKALRREIHKSNELQSEIQWLANHDELTKLPNRRHFLDKLEELQDCRPLSLILCDIDHFKQINDQLGHLEGDRYLQAFATLGKSVITAQGGVFARYGGEEFVAWLPGHGQASALAVAETLRLRISQHGLTYADGRMLTLSAGVVTQEHTQEIDINRLMQAADEALYRAKNNGRNRVLAATPV
ncbi:sensor domain-containing diguanylate cyclase [Vreelandella rituensis]|nr:sensor domain-containing diguanylate cyclase [Halomonas rituensis]